MSVPCPSHAACACLYDLVALLFAQEQIAAAAERLQTLRSEMMMQEKKMVTAQQDVIALQQQEEQHRLHLIIDAQYVFGV